MKIEIGGHTDNIGSAQSNLRISQSRANAVKIWLLKKGIAEQRLVAKGYGESQPLASNDDEINGRELNRRIEIIVFK
jgi:outer membrane protein OmpA-like peptidoglycan-associated protein